MSQVPERQYSPEVEACLAICRCCPNFIQESAVEAAVRCKARGGKSASCARCWAKPQHQLSNGCPENKWPLAEQPAPIPVMKKIPGIKLKVPVATLPAEYPAASTHLLGERNWQEYFRCFVINLDKRPDRLARFLDRMPKDWPTGNFERWPGVDGSKIAVPSTWRDNAGGYGLYRSTMNLLEKVYFEDLHSKAVFICEDDAIPGVNAVEVFNQVMPTVPSDWDLLFFGVEHIHPAKYHSHGLVRCTSANRCHAYAISGPFIAKLMNIYAHHFGHIDWAITNACPTIKAFAFNPPIFAQGGGFSDIALVSKPVEAWGVKLTDHGRKLPGTV